MEAREPQKVNEWLEKLAHTPGEPGDIRSTLQHIVEVAQSLFETDICLAFAFHPITDRFIHMEPAIMVGEMRGSVQPYDPPRADGLARGILRQGMVVVEDLEMEPDLRRPFTTAERVQAFVALPLRTRHRKKPLAVLYLNYRQKRTFSKEELAVFQTFTTQAAFILQEAWLAWRHREVASLGQEINHELSTVEDLFQKLQKRVESIINVSSTFLLAIYHQQSDAIGMHVQPDRDTRPEKTAALEYVCRAVIKSQQPLFFQQLSKETDKKNLKIHEIVALKESLIALPLVLRDLSLGVLLVQHPQQRTYNKEDQFILQLLANHIAQALNNIRLYNNLQQLNEFGQLITQQLEPETALQATVERIGEATKGDIVILFPYNEGESAFVFPPYTFGQFLESSSVELFRPEHPDDIAYRILRHAEAIFARKNTTLVTELYGHENAMQSDFERREQTRSTAALPLRLNDELVGVLLVYFRQAQRFDASQKLLITGLGHYAAIAIKNAHKFDTFAKQRTAELKILQNIDRELSHNRDLGQTHQLEMILRLALERTPADEATIKLYDAEAQEFWTAAAVGPHAQERREGIIPVRERSAIVQWVFEQKKPARVANVYKDVLWRDLYFSASSETIAELDVPMFDENEVVGVLNFESAKEAAFSAEDETFLVTLAGQAVLALKNEQAYKREQQFAREGQVLNEISKEITSHLDSESVFGLILDKALELTEATQGTLLLYDADLNDLWVADQRGVSRSMKGQHVSLEEGIIGYTARYKQVLNVDPTAVQWKELYVEWIPGMRSELAIPMLAANELRGMLDVESTQPGKFNERDERLLKALADMAVVALQNAERYDRAEREAKRFALLYESGKQLNSIHDFTQITETYQTVLRIVKLYDMKSHVVVRCYDEEQQELIACGSSQEGEDFPAITFDKNIFMQEQQEQRTVLVYDMAHPSFETMRDHLPDPAIRSLVIVHVRFKDAYYGTLEMSHQEMGYFRHSDVQFLEGLAHQLGSTLYRLYSARERQEAEKRILMAEQISAIGESAFELTHRLGNDLGLVPSFVRDVRRELELQDPNGVVNKKLDDIVHAVQKVLSLSKKLKDDHIEQSKLETPEREWEVVRPEVLIEDALDAVALPESIEVKKEIESDGAPVEVVPVLVVSILYNLILNAKEAMSDRGRLTICAHNAGRNVAIEVTDTGEGIPTRMQNEIFNPFFSTKGSTGYGLWSARNNALKNRGELKVKSEPGKGATFTLSLPKANAESVS